MDASEKSNSDRVIDLIKLVYSGLNQNDSEAVISLLDPQVIRKEFEGTPSAGIYRGHIELRRHIESGRSTWAEGACNPVGFACNENRVVVTVHVKVRLKNQTKWIDAYSTDGFSVKDGLVTEFHSFTSKEKALEWAGMPET